MRTALAFLLAATIALAQEPADFEGEWLTDHGVMTLEQDGAAVTGRYGRNSLEGKVEGNKLVFSCREGHASGEGSFELGEDGYSFTGKWQLAGGRRSGSWRGWRKDPDAEKGDPADFSGVWLSSLGTLNLEQQGPKVTGSYGSQGWAMIEGTVKGRRLHFTWQRIKWSGEAWIELARDGKGFFGKTEEQRFTKWLGVKLEGFAREVKAKPGEIVQGLSENHMCYFLRAPKSYDASRPSDAIVLLHGSNWTTKGMVWVTARNWPDLGRKFVIIGIQGEKWADWSTPPDLRFNYSYANWMGRSKYKGYPHTDRESPYLVMQVVRELKRRHNLGRIFVGGHSQGGFCTSAIYMHHAEELAGAFLMSCGIIIQAEPDVFEDEALMKAQRASPLAIVHGTRDSAVGFSTGEYNFDRFAASGFPLLAFFTKEVGHGYDFLPIGETVRWLDALSTTDKAQLKAFAEKRARERGWRDVAAALIRARALKTDFSALKSKLNRAAVKDAAKYRRLIQASKDNKWMDGFLRWRDDFEFAPAAKSTMEAFYRLRDEHDPAAEKLLGEARKAFQKRDQKTGWAKYEEITKKYYCARRYRVVKRWLKNRK